MPEQLDQNVTVELDASDEYYACDELRFADTEHDVLDEGHPIIYVHDA
jgi:hypothetical protein